tara:strand:+ start:886 stop:1092 length:207 start_codon:yes stop_codon:yes gene_type:complete
MSVNFYDVLSKVHMRAAGSVEKSVAEDLQAPDPTPEDAKAILESSTEDEDTRGNDRSRGSKRNRKSSK